MNILYINHYAGSLYHGMEYRPYYLAREWVKQGHTVTIVASNVSHLRSPAVELPAAASYKEEFIDGIRYFWCRTTPYQHNGIKRLINIFSFLRKLWSLNHLIITQPLDLVIASSTYPFDTLIAKALAQKYSAKFIYEVHDLWPLTPIEVGGMAKWHPLIMAMQWAENYGYKHADKVVSLLPQAANYMQEHGMLASKFVYIPNGVASLDWLNAKQELPPIAQNLLDRFKQLDNKFIIGYAGGMGDANALDFLLDAAKLLTDLPLVIVMVGDGPKREHLQQRLHQEAIKNVFMLPRLSKTQIPNFLRACDALYIGWNKLPIYRFGICPNKLFDYMLSSRPIVHSVTAGNDLVREANCGISVAAADVKQIATALKDIAAMPHQERNQLGCNGYNYALNNHDYYFLATHFLNQVLT